MRAAMRGRARCHSHAQIPGAPTGRMNGRYVHGNRSKECIARRAYTTERLRWARRVLRLCGEKLRSPKTCLSGGRLSSPVTRGDRAEGLLHRHSRVVSIHAPVKGRRSGVTGRYVRFNPRPRQGARHPDLFGPDHVVSIHAPVKGRHCGSRRASPTVSIHAPAKGATRPSTSSTAHDLFQSTPPRRGRPRHGAADRRWFQSTPPRRGRRRAEPLRASDVVSIHAPAKGRPDRASRPQAMFQSTPS